MKTAFPPPEGLKFECTKCGDCCKRHGDHGYVYVNRLEIAAMAARLNLSHEEFEGRYVRLSEGMRYLKWKENACILVQDGRCTVDKAKPGQCRTFPFWEENLTPTAWRGAARYCEGIGRGKAWTPGEIKELIQTEGRA